MKTIRIIFFALCINFISISLIGGEINWIYNDVDKALNEAKKTDKLIMIDAYTEWCGWCTELDNKTYSAPDVIEFSKNFINLKLDGDNKKSAKFLSKYDITGYPTILFIDANKELVKKIVGFKTPVPFLSETKELVKNKEIGNTKIEWIYDDYKKALSEAKKTDKLIMIDVYAEWCGWCTELDNKTYSNSDVSEFSKNFINLKIDAENNKNSKFLEKYKIAAYPTILFIDGNENIINNISGFKKPEPFLNDMKTSLDSIILKKEFESENYNNSSNYIKKLYEAKNYSEVIVVYEKLNSLKKINSEDKYNIVFFAGDSYRMLSNFKEAHNLFVIIENFGKTEEHYWEAICYNSLAILEIDGSQKALDYIDKYGKVEKPDYVQKFLNQIVNYCKGL